VFGTSTGTVRGSLYHSRVIGTILCYEAL